MPQGSKITPHDKGGLQLENDVISGSSASDNKNQQH